MGSLMFAGFLVVVGIIAMFAPVPEMFSKLKRVAATAVIAVGGLTAALGAISYNDAGYCVHIRTIFGTETSKCDLGWYVSAWGTTNEYPHYITISHTKDSTTGSVSDMEPHTIRMSDNWTGDVIQTTRFGIPQDEEQFLRMARDYRSYERLVVTLLRPSVIASLDSVANLYSMEEYWTGGKRDEFKTEFEQAVQKGRPAVDRFEEVVNGPSTNPEVAASDSEVLEDTASTGSGNRVRVITRKRLDSNGNEIRIPHDYLDYGIVASSAIVEQINPDDIFELRIQERKEAASRRVIAREQRLEQEEQRLLAISKAERDIAERQGQARVTQIEATTDAETKKRLALVEAERVREEARIQEQTAKIQLERARIDAESIRVTADADAYAREQALQADNALALKLETEKVIQQVWADAYAKRSVPQIVFGGSSGDSSIPVGADDEVTRLMQLLTVDTAKRLSYDRTIAE